MWQNEAVAGVAGGTRLLICETTAWVGTYSAGWNEWHERNDTKCIKCNLWFGHTTKSAIQVCACSRKATGKLRPKLSLMNHFCFLHATASYHYCVVLPQAKARPVTFIFVFSFKFINTSVHFKLYITFYTIMLVCTCVCVLCLRSGKSFIHR